LLPPLQVPPLQVQDAPGDAQRELERGTASWYGPRFHGRRTASGERYNQQAFTAAHRTLPFGTLVRVRSLVNGREVEVRITDRGPYALGAAGRNRIIDVSRAAAVELDMVGLGVKEVALFVAESLAIDIPPTKAPVKKRRTVRKKPSP
jgi:rare lipoprotein A